MGDCALLANVGLVEVGVVVLNVGMWVWALGWASRGAGRLGGRQQRRDPRRRGAQTRQQRDKAAARQVLVLHTP